MTALTDLSAERARLMVELEAVEARLRGAACDAVAAGAPIARVARECGVTRPTLYSWVRQAEGPGMVRRLAELDARYERLVDVLVEVLKPAPQLSRKGNLRSGLQAEQSASTYLKRGKRTGDVRTPTRRLRDQAESLLLALGADAIDVDMIRECGEQAGFRSETGDIIGVIVAELDEAYALRKRVEAGSDPFAD